MYSRIFFLLLSALLIQITALSQSNWQLKKANDGVKVYTQKQVNSRVVTFKAISVYPQSPEILAKTIVDLKNNHKWIDGIAAGQLISKSNENDFIFRQIVLLPFPFDNREVVQHTKITRNNGSIRIDINEANDKVEPLKGYVRMKVSHGYWLLEPTSEGTKLSYVFTADPGDSIPKWLINRFIVDSPYHTLLQLRSFLGSN